MTNSLADNMTLTLKADALPAFLIQAHALAHAGRHEEAGVCLGEEPAGRLPLATLTREQALSCWTVLGSTCRRLGRLAEAARAYEEVRAGRVDAAVLHELIAIYRNLGRFSLALQRSEQAMEHWGHYPELQTLHAECLISLGRLDEGVDLLQRLIDSGQATAETHLQALWYLSYQNKTRREDLFAAHQQWARRYASCRDSTPSPPARRSENYRLRIGYLSSDFRTHSVTYTFEPLLDGHDRDRFEILGYGHVAHPDETTERLKRKFDQYHDVRGQTVRDIADRIRADRLDILVGLATHCSAVCLQVMALRPAPVQVDIGSVCSTGLSQIDARITDALQDPPETQAFHSETLVHIPGGFIPYAAPPQAPAVGPLPALRCGQVTFGSFANQLKINREVVAIWSEILKRIPRSRLLIKTPGGHDPGVTEYLLRAFSDRGVTRNKIRVMGWLPKQAHWDLYNQIDIALDTFPYNGGLTNLEALWMGVPTISCVGQTFVARTGWAILNHAGLSSMVAASPEKMIDKAVALAQHLDMLATLRTNLRAAIAAGPLCRPQRLAQGLETAYQRLWREKMRKDEGKKRGR